MHRFSTSYHKNRGQIIITIGKINPIIHQHTTYAELFLIGSL